MSVPDRRAAYTGEAMLSPAYEDPKAKPSIRALRTSDAGVSRSVDPEEAVSLARGNEGMTWIHIIAYDLEATRGFLADKLGFHELAVEDALSKTERPSVQEYQDTLFLVIPAVAPDGSKEEFCEVAFFLNAHALVTVVMKPVPILEQWFHRFEVNCRWVSDEPSRLLHALLDALVDEYFPALDQMEDEVEDIADRIFKGDTTLVRSVLRLKKLLTGYRRALLPVRDIMNALMRRDMKWISDDVRPYFNDVYDHVLRLTEVMDINRDTLTSLLDVHLSTVSNNLNEVMKKMTVISTALMSMALIAGVYGMNFKFIPELEWHYGYAFAWALMLGLGAAIVAIFRKLGWF